MFLRSFGASEGQELRPIPRLRSKRARCGAVSQIMATARFFWARPIRKISQFFKRIKNVTLACNADGALPAKLGGARIVASKGDQEMSERRQSTRRRTYLGGRACFEKLAASDSCLVRDLSEGGARVVLSGSTPMPNAFDLTLRESGEERRVQVIWRDGLQLGVAYESTAAPFAPEAARRIRRLEADRNALLRRLARIDELPQ